MPVLWNCRHCPEAAAVPNQLLWGHLEVKAGQNGKRKKKEHQTGVSPALTLRGSPFLSWEHKWRAFLGAPLCTCAFESRPSNTGRGKISEKLAAGSLVL